MNIHNATGPLASTTSQTLVLFATQEGDKLSFAAKNLNLAKALKLVERSHKSGRFKGAAKETVFFRAVDTDGFENVMVVGLGKKKDVNDEVVRLAAAGAAKALAKEKIFSATISLHTLHKITKSPEAAAQALAEGLILGSYKYDELKSKKNDDKEQPKDTDFYFSIDDKTLSKKTAHGIEIGKILGEATCFARDLGNAPANLLTPTILADRAREAAKGLPIKFQALDLKQIQTHKMGALIGVNKGSAEEPRFIIMEYHGGKKSDKPLILVGKGLTFDSGGISIKPAGGMEDMKFDMCGSAAVISAIVAIAKLKLKINVVTLVASTENMPGGAAVKPGDVLTAMNGKTIEVNNTDAEGRLVLADALCYACKHYKPLAIVDVATLTGACVIALGNVFSGVFTKDLKFLKKIQTASEASGERVWQLPLTDEYVDDVKGTYADLQNVSYAKGAGSSQAAAFLSQFVDKDIPWAHFDIAGSAYNNGSRYAYNPDKGANGVAVRLFTHLAKILS